MPLQSPLLVSELRKFMDKEYEQFQGFPKDPTHQNTQERFQNKWANAVFIYSGTQIFPPSTSGVQAREAMKKTLSKIDNTTLGGGIGGLKDGLVAYVTQLGLGMQPTFTANPPQRSNLNLQVLSTPNNDASLVATQLATQIDSWFKTGTATNNTSGATVNWA
jgi:hypothetical protein